MIDSTPNAVRHLRELLASRNSPPSHGLRLSVDRGGCAGLQYLMNVRAPEPGDVVIERDGVRLFIDPDCAPLLRGSRLDYEESLTDAGFKIDNPNAVRSCGCGTSFETASPPRSS
ncbi:MAG: HesB/IscA family protein [Verrucomicrobiales bacterium]